MSFTRTYDGPEPVRVNKWLAQAGVCSRREAEELIAAGAVLIDGERVSVAELMALDGVREPDPAILRRALAAPVHYKMRVDFENKLARLF